MMRATLVILTTLAVAMRASAADGQDEAKKLDFTWSVTDWVASCHSAVCKYSK
jgi:hypothetical protein